jgi:hypothetical protein
MRYNHLTVGRSGLFEYQAIVAGGWVALDRATRATTTIVVFTRRPIQIQASNRQSGHESRMEDPRFTYFAAPAQWKQRKLWSQESGTLSRRPETAHKRMRRSLRCATWFSGFAMNLTQVLANVATRRTYNRKVQQP